MVKQQSMGLTFELSEAIALGSYNSHLYSRRCLLFFPERMALSLAISMIQICSFGMDKLFLPSFFFTLIKLLRAIILALYVLAYCSNTTLYLGCNYSLYIWNMDKIWLWKVKLFENALVLCCSWVSLWVQKLVLYGNNITSQLINATVKTFIMTL